MQVTSRRKAYSVTEAAAVIAERTGVELKPRTVRTYCRQGVIKAVQPHGPGGNWYIRVADLNLFIKARIGTIDTDDPCA